jgi:glutamine synthetase
MLSVADLEDAGIRQVAIATPDTQGRPVGRTVPVERFMADPEAGVDISSYALIYDLAGMPLFDSPFAGPHSGYHDIRLKPDLETLRHYPGAEGTVLCVADVVDAHGEFVAYSPRTILRQQVDAAKQAGFDVVMASELEFYLFRESPFEARAQEFRGLHPTTPERSTYGIAPAIAQREFLQAVTREMERARVSASSAQTEAGRGQWEVNLDHADPLTSADAHLAFKLGVKEIARAQGMSATFMARPIADDLGSSCHIHLSLLREGEPIFPKSPGSGEVSQTARHAIGGLLFNLAASAIFLAPYVNSYKRHVPGFAAGQITAWGMDNRSVAIRVAGHGSSLRLEHRYPGADVNPYLAMAVLIAAALDGIQSNRDPGSPAMGDADAQCELPRPPSSLGAAIDAFMSSTFGVDLFGDDVARHFAAHAQAEWSASLAAVTDWEVIRGFDAV